MTADFSALRRNMVDCQLRTYDVTDRAVLAAMDSVPREVFVPEARREVAYIDQPVALDGLGAAGRALLAPMTAGRMLQTLDIQPGQRLLDFACGTGYSAAVALAMGATVVAYDSSAALREAARAALAEADAGAVTVVDALPDAKFDLIMVNGACDGMPKDLADRLADGGRMVVVEGAGRAGRVMLYQRSGDSVGGRAVFDAAAPVLAEFRKAAIFAL
ncbi:MAG: protein-L-isoaspartate O-methyltransferase family protein [Bosea sp. (in: a-proteobacteria)]